jgi:hypothetical protein
MKTEQIQAIVERCDGSPKSIKEAVNRLLVTEDKVINVGDTVAVTDDLSAIGGMVGKAKVKSFSEDNQYANCEFPDGRVVPVLTNTIYKVTAD